VAIFSARHATDAALATSQSEQEFPRYPLSCRADCGFDVAFGALPKHRGVGLPFAYPSLTSPGTAAVLEMVIAFRAGVSPTRRRLNVNWFTFTTQ